MSLLATVVLVCQGTWIVDAANGPGTNFTDLPPAVAAAQTGDTLLVRSGSYTAFAVSGKALTIRGAGAVNTIVERTTATVTFTSIGPTPAGTTFGLAGMLFRPVNPGTVTTPIPALQVLSGAQVALTDCTLLGAAPGGPGPFATDAPGTIVQGALHAARCTFRGSSGTIGTSNVASVGLRVDNGGVLSADACTVTGGTAFGNFAGSSLGGAGLLVVGARASIARSTLRGGDAGTITRFGFSIPGSGVSATNGGIVRISGTSSDSCSAGISTSTIGAFGAVAVATDPGSAVRVHGAVQLLSNTGPTMGNVTFDVALPRVVITGTTLPSGETNAALPVTIRIVSAQPNAPALMLVDVHPEFSTALAPFVLGEVLVSGDAPIRLDAVLDSQGTTSLTVTPAAVIPQALGFPLFVQAGVWDGARVLASSREIRILSL